jgi:hypothetical protein
LEVSGQLHALPLLSPGGRAAGTRWIGGWVNPIAGLDDVEKRIFLNLPGLELLPSVVAVQCNYWKYELLLKYRKKAKVQEYGFYIM